MNKNNIVQFVCFVTNLDLDIFGARWEHYAAQFMNRTARMTLQKAVAGSNKNKFAYISQHECSTENFRFNFMKERNSEHFPEHTAKVVQAGGYLPVQVQCAHAEGKGDVKIIAFIDAPETDFSFYHRQNYRHLNIYEAYYENCAYSYIMEFFVQETEAAALVKELKTKPGIEAVIYKECSTLHFEKVVS
jgi:hypothetical protein